MTLIKKLNHTINNLSIRKKFIVIKFIIVALATIGMAGFFYIDNILYEIIHRENPKVEAILEMEINIKEGTQNVLNYNSLMGEKKKIKFNSNVKDFIRFREQYGNKIVTNYEKKYLSKVDSLFFIYRKVATDLFQLKSKQDAIFERCSKLVKDSIDHILDDVLQSQVSNDSKKKRCTE